ncbi:MAG: protein kinase, partial [Thermomicrobiales bacterium]|nr:protein kinase [Thermomicrobiales bacterium]
MVRLRELFSTGRLARQGSTRVPFATASLTDLSEHLQSGLADRYRIERELGRGGMATVFLAHDLRNERSVALKVLHPELAATLGPERFQREIKLAARLQNPHILTVHDSGEAAGQLWYTMPFVRGESLRDRLRREGQLPIAVAVDLARQVALALDYAHREGVVHRDLKPENILLSDGQALVADFGIAKALSAAGEVQLTETGLAVGTPAYMSPEQAAGGQLDGRSDVYALGCVVYEMLAGEPPFSGATPQAVIAKRVLEPVPHVRTLRDSVPEPVEQALTRALAKAPADRFPNAAEFARALGGPAVRTPSESTGFASPTAATAPLPQLRRKPLIPTRAAAVGLALLIIVAGVFAWWRTHPASRQGNPSLARLAVLPFQNLGDSADAYFADGITDAVRGKLAGIPGLQLIASTSSEEYRGTRKTPSQVARELGVRYLLIGKVRWQKVSGMSRVQVSPELVDLGDPDAPTTQWQQPFDAALTDVFQAQTDIAARVAEALGVTLGDSARRQLAARPTQDLAAYDAYLRGLDLRRTDAPAAVAAFEQAIAQDSAFALAWADLAITRQHFSSVGFTPPDQVERSKGDAERALAIQPRLPRGYFALGQYYTRRGEYDRALAEYARGRAVAPNDGDLLSGVAEVHLRLGEWDRAIRAARGVELLDPRSTLPLLVETFALMHARRFHEVFAVAERGMALDPSAPQWYEMRIETRAAQGDLAGARRELDFAHRRLGYARAVVYLGRQYDPQWVLPDSAKAFLLRQRPEVMEGDTADWGLTLAIAARFLGDTGRARAYADTAQRWLEARRSAQPPDDLPADYWRTGVCLAHALAGNAREARRSCEALLERPSADVTWRFAEHFFYARAAVVLGDAERALSALERLTRGPGWATPAWLRLDPTFAPLRGNPRFERLIQEP